MEDSTAGAVGDSAPAEHDANESARTRAIPRARPDLGMLPIERRMKWRGRPVKAAPAIQPPRYIFLAMLSAEALRTAFWKRRARSR
jgi:hypothetical protein